MCMEQQSNTPNALQNEAWHTFEQSGQIADYLRYVRLSAEETPVHAAQNPGTGTQTTQYR
jgi:hypothetical protein